MSHGKPHSEQDQIGEEKLPVSFDSRVGRMIPTAMLGPDK